VAARYGASVLLCAALSAVAGWNMAFVPVTASVQAKPEPVRAAIAAPKPIAVEFTVALRVSVDGPEILPPPEPPLVLTQAPTIMEELETLPTRHAAEIARWSEMITEASSRFGVPKSWIRAVMAQESGGKTSLTGRAPIRSRAGAMGLMQVMPGTYADLRREYGLGADPYDPRDNILAGTAYLAQLRARYGYPGLFAAYNHGPGNFEKHLETGRALPRETKNYLTAVTADVRRAKRAVAKAQADAAADLRLASL